MKAFKNGPVLLQKRQCTDIICLIVFVMFSFTMFSIAAYAWTHENFTKLTKAFDADGKGCGIDYPDYPYIYFTSLHVDQLWKTVCVSECPSDKSTEIQCMPNSVVTSCFIDHNSTSATSIHIYESNILGTMCLPTSTILSKIIESHVKYSSEQIVTLMEHYQLLLFALPIAIIVAIVIMVLVRFTACIFVYLLIMTVSGGLIGIGFFLLMNDSLGFGNSLIPFFENSALKKMVAIILISLGAIVLVIMCCIRNKLFLVSKILQVAANFIAKNLYLIIFLLGLLLLQGGIVTLWVFQALGYYSLGEPQAGQGRNLPYTYFKISNSIIILASIHTFYLFWWILFLNKVNCFFISGTVASWYYSKETPFYDTTLRFFKKHMGSVLLGSFFKVVLGLTKFIYDIFEPKQSQNESSCHTILRQCFTCLCCLCTKLFHWLNKGGYIVMNITGDDYYESINKGVQVRLHSIIVTGIVQGLQEIFSNIIKLGIISLTMMGIYVIVDNVESYKSMKDPTLVFVLVGVIGFSVSSFFTAAYGDTLEALLITYHLDIESGGKLKRVPEQLRQFLAEARRKEYIITE